MLAVATLATTLACGCVQVEQPQARTPERIREEIAAGARSIAMARSQGRLADVLAALAARGGLLLELARVDAANRGRLLRQAEGVFEELVMTCDGPMEFGVAGLLRLAKIEELRGNPGQARSAYEDVIAMLDLVLDEGRHSGDGPGAIDQLRRARIEALRATAVTELSLIGRRRGETPR